MKKYRIVKRFVSLDGWVFDIHAIETGNCFKEKQQAIEVMDCIRGLLIQKSGEFAKIYDGNQDK